MILTERDLMVVSTTRMPAALTKLPAGIRRQITSQCGGDWRRVSVDPDGSITVHNQPQTPRSKPATKPKKTTAPARPARNPPPPAASPPDVPCVVQPAALVAPAPKPLLVRALAATTVPLLEESMEASAQALMARCANGLPAEYPYEIHPNVLELSWLDLSILNAAVRYPQAVDVAPETFVHGYPVLRFRRGDILTVLGFRLVNQPKVIAHYLQSLLTGSRIGGNSDQHHAGGATGARGNIPRTSRAQLRAFMSLGASITHNPDADNAQIFYGDALVGTVATGQYTHSNKITSDYHRITRKLHAIATAQACDPNWTDPS